MYVTPFWSYSQKDEKCLVTNWITKRGGLVEQETIALLKSVYMDPGFHEESDLFYKRISAARSLQLIFESKSEADSWYEEIEQAHFKKFPRVDQIELTNRCPYSCKMCPRTTSMDRQIGDMPLELFERIIGQIKESQAYVALHHFGESLVYKNLPEAVSIATSNGLQTGLSCNPPSLHPKIGRRLLEAGISNVVLSFDSLAPETYRNIRGTAADFERGDAYLREFVRLRNEGGYAASITLQMINMHCNSREGAGFLQYCEDVGVDRGVVIRLGRWDFDDSYVEELGDFNGVGYTDYCRRPWDSVVVLWDGRVVPCCHDYNGEVILGDLKNQTLEEIWESDRNVMFRRENYDNEFCRKCAFSRWYRERQRDRLGFTEFHREVRSNNNRMEWINPAVYAGRDTVRMFDGFDIMTV